MQASHLKLKPLIRDFMMICACVIRRHGGGLIEALSSTFHFIIVEFVYGCFASMYFCASNVCLVLQRPEEDVKSLELELQLVMGHYIDAGTRT